MMKYVLHLLLLLSLLLITGGYPKAEATVIPKVTLTKYDNKTIELEGGKPDKDGLYKPYASLEGGTDTIAHGHKLTKSEINSGKIFGIPYKNGLSEEQAAEIYLKDKERLTSSLGLGDVSEEAKFLAADVAHRAGNIKSWQFTKALKAGDLDRAFISLGNFNWRDTKGQKRSYNKRNFEIFKEIGYTPSKETLEAYFKKQRDAGII